MEQFIAFSLFAFVASITPGPTNVLLLNLGARFGVRSTVPIIFGSGAGAALIVLVVGAGLGATLVQQPMVQSIMSWVGAVWLSVLAWQIYHSSPEVNVAGSKPRLGLAGAAGLQLLNPKTWMMALAVSSVFSGQGDDVLIHVFSLSLIFFVIALPCLFAWAYLGFGASRLIKSPGKVRLFNRLMALLLLLSVWGSLLL